MSITATVENDTIKLPVHVPDGTKVEIVLPAVVSETPDWLQRAVGAATTGLTTDEIMRLSRGED